MLQLPEISLEKEGPTKHYVSLKIAEELDKIKVKVLKYEWDYVAVVAGLPGSGKSTFARGCAKHCDPNFGIDNIVFTADDFINFTANCPEYSAVVYDECFEGMNSRVTLSPDFQRIVNHLQLIRKRHLFIFLCLPNFFDLSKGIAVFRTSHLFVTYATEDGRRGRVMAFSRDNKRKLYVEGGKYMNYSAVKSNFQTTFMKNDDIVNAEEYETKKDKILQARAVSLQSKSKEKISPSDKRMATVILSFKKHKMKQVEMAKLFGIPPTTLHDIIKRYHEWGLLTETEVKSLENDE